FSPAWEVTPDTLRMKKSKNHPGFAMDRASCNDTRTVGRATPPRTGCGETLSLTKWRNYKRIKAACQQNGKENFHSRKSTWRSGGGVAWGGRAWGGGLRRRGE